MLNVDFCHTAFAQRKTGAEKDMLKEPSVSISYLLDI